MFEVVVVVEVDEEDETGAGVVPGVGVEVERWILDSDCGTGPWLDGAALG